MAIDKAAPPIIMTSFGPVTESARVQAAINMRLDPAKRAAVIELLAKQLYGGDLALGEEEARRRFPEGFEEPS
jgi:hypothetical protein